MHNRCADLCLIVLMLSVFLGTGAASEERPLQVCASVPELGDLFRQVGGEKVEVQVFAKPSEDPHFVEARPDFIRKLHKADVFAVVGLDLEVAWAPVLWEQARNDEICPGKKGYFDASRYIQPLDVPAGKIDRSMGDVHPGGNPHYLLDPLSGLSVARGIEATLSELRPAQKEFFAGRLERFKEKLGEKLVGEALAAQYDAFKLTRLHHYGKLLDFLKAKNEDGLLKGWIGQVAPFYGAPVVDDHAIWTYFAKTFGLRVVAHLEPLPGVSPTTKHLTKVVEQIRAEKVRVLLSNAYYDPKSARKVASLTDVKVARMAHQAGACEGTEDYLAMVDHNVREVVAGLKGQ